MKTFLEFMSICEAAYDKEVMQSSQIRTVGPEGRIGSKRTKTTPERKRMKSVKDPETGKVKRVPIEPKTRKDVGVARPTSTRVQQPQKERGSKEVAQSYAEKVKAERRAAAKARAAAKTSGGTAPKPKSKELEKTASKLLTTKKSPEKKPSGDKEDHMIKGSLLPKGEQKRPYTREEKKKIVRTGKRVQSDIQKGKEKPSSEYQKSLN